MYLGGRIEIARADITKLESIAGITEMGEPVPISYENYGIRNRGKKQQIALAGMGPQLPDFDHPVVTKGRWLEAGEKGSIVVDSGAASLLKLKVGDRFMLRPGSHRVAAELAGYYPFSANFTVGHEQGQAVKFQLERLPQQANIGAIKRADPGLLQLAAGHHDQGQIAGAAAQLFQKPEARALRHVDVRDDELKRAIRHPAERCVRVVCFENVEAEVDEIAREQTTHGCVVIDQQNSWFVWARHCHLA